MWVSNWDRSEIKRYQLRIGISWRIERRREGLGRDRSRGSWRERPGCRSPMIRAVVQLRIRVPPPSLMEDLQADLHLNLQLFPMFLYKKCLFCLCKDTWISIQCLQFGELKHLARNTLACWMDSNTKPVHSPRYILSTQIPGPRFLQRSTGLQYFFK